MNKFLYLIFLLGYSNAYADISDCKNIPTDFERLACYDNAAAGNTEKVDAATLDKTIVPPKKENKDIKTRLNLAHWVVNESASELTDRKSIYISTESNEIINCGWNRGSKITLMLRCLENKTSILLNTGCHMTSSRYTDYGDVKFRVDKKPMFKRGLIESTNNRTLGLWSGGSSIPVLKNFFNGEKLIVQMTPFSESPFTASFNIKGIEDVVKPLRSTCGW